jgi:competence protein ComGC
VGIALAAVALVASLVVGIVCIMWKRGKAFDGKGTYGVVKVRKSSVCVYTCKKPSEMEDLVEDYD